MMSFLLPFKPAVLEYMCVKQCAVHGTVVLGLRSPSQAKYKLWHVYRDTPSFTNPGFLKPPSESQQTLVPIAAIRGPTGGYTQG